MASVHGFHTCLIFCLQLYAECGLLRLIQFRRLAVMCVALLCRAYAHCSYSGPVAACNKQMPRSYVGAASYCLHAQLGQLSAYYMLCLLRQVACTSGFAEQGGCEVKRWSRLHVWDRVMSFCLLQLLHTCVCSSVLQCRRCLTTHKGCAGSRRLAHSCCVWIEAPRTKLAECGQLLHSRCRLGQCAACLQAYAVFRAWLDTGVRFLIGVIMPAQGALPWRGWCFGCLQALVSGCAALASLCSHKHNGDCRPSHADKAGLVDEIGRAHV